MDFTSMKTFSKVSELRSFSQAAAQLGYAQPTVSTQIAKLEQELGYLLFERMGHRIALTDQGKIFLQYVQQILLLAEQMQNDMCLGENVAGTLRIAMADSLCSCFMQQYLLTYKKLYPDVSVSIYTGTTEVLFRYLTHNEVDLVYTLDNRIFRSEYVVNEENVEPVYFCARADHPLAVQLIEESRESICLTDIKKYPLYLTEAGVSYRQNLEWILGEMGEELKPTVELGNVRLLLSLTQESDGITFLPEFVIRDCLEDGSMVILPVKDIEIKVWRQLIYHRGKFLTPAICGMMDLLHQRIENEKKQKKDMAF